MRVFHSACLGHMTVQQGTSELTVVSASELMGGQRLREGSQFPVSPSRASLVAQLLKNLPAMQETWV